MNAKRTLSKIVLNILAFNLIAAAVMVNPVAAQIVIGGGGGGGPIGNPACTYPMYAGGLYSFTAISAGSYRSLAIRDNGTVWVLGSNDLNPDHPLPQTITPPLQISGLTNVVSVAVAQSVYPYSYAVESDGSVWAFKDDGTSGLTQVTIPYSPVNPGQKIVSITVSSNPYYSRALALDNEGNVWEWNDNTSPFSTPIKQSIPTPVSSVASGYSHDLALTTAGTVWAWGGNDQGQIGNGTSRDNTGIGPTQVVDPTNTAGGPNNGMLINITAIAASNFGSLALKTDGTVSGWGTAFYGELGDDINGAMTITPTPITRLSNIASISAGDYHSLFVSNNGGTVQAMGLNDHGQLGNGTGGDLSNTYDSAIPVSVSSISGVTNVSAGVLHSMALKSDGTVWGWGAANNSGGVGSGALIDSNIPVTVHFNCSVAPNSGPAISGTDIVITGSNFSTDGPTIVTFGSDPATPGLNPLVVNPHTIDVTTPSGTAGAVNVNVTNNGSTTTITNGFTYTGSGGGPAPAFCAFSGFTANSIITGDNSSFALKSDGTVWAWGDTYGQFGAGGSETSNIPVQVPGLTGITAIAAGKANHALALKGDGTVWAWGYNPFGQLGDGSTTDHLDTPVQVSNLAGITAIAAGVNHSLALKGDGTVWAWGMNAAGELGDGTGGDRTLNHNSDVPVQVSNLTDITAITAGSDHSLALKGDGTVWAWGYNEFGQLGDGTVTDRNAPVQVSGLSGMTGLTAGFWHSVALKGDGTVWSWGFNEEAELGDGTTTSRSSPVQVTGLSGVMTSISSKDNHSLALKSDGTVWAWGYQGVGHYGGQLFDMSAAQLSEFSSITAIADGASYILALKSDNTIWSEGQNSYGQLGDGTNTTSSSPVQVSATALCVPISPDNGATDGGTAVTISGSDFQPGAHVTFGSETPVLVSVDSTSTTLLVTTPAHTTPETVDVIVTNPDSQFVTLTNGFTYTYNPPSPLITSINPTHGSASTTTDVTINGTNLQTGAAVAFGTFSGMPSTIPATNVIAAGDGLSLTATAPTHWGNPGPVDVGITNTDAFLPGSFTYIKSTLAANPTSLPPDGTSTSTLTATLLDAPSHGLEGITINIAPVGNTTPVAANCPGTSTPGVTDINGKACFTVTAPNSAGDATYTVTNSYDSATPQATIHFQNVSNVGHAEIHLGRVDAVLSSHQVTTGISDGSTPSVDNSPSPLRREPGHFINSFGDQPANTFYTVDPTAGGTDPKAVSYNFASDGTVADSSIPYSPDTLSNSDPSYAVENVGGGTPNLDDDLVSDPITIPFNVKLFGVDTNQIAISSNGFIYVKSDPNNSSWTPSVETGCCGGNEMGAQTISGTDFMVAGTWTDLFPSSQGTIATQVFGTAPNRRFVVDFTNVPAYGDTTDNSFQIKLFELAPAPVATGVATSTGGSSGTVNGGTPIIITGTNFQPTGTTAVTVGGVPATNVVVASSTSITATTPAATNHASGSADIVVTNPDGQTTILAGQFTFTGSSGSSGDSTGNINIGCNTVTGGLSLQTPTDIDFAARHTDFYASTDASALHESSIPGDLSRIRITDTRGFDANHPSGPSLCGGGFTFQIQSSGLHQYNVDGSDVNLRLGLGTVANSILTEDSSITTSSPDVLVGGIVNAATTSSNQLINTSADLVTSTEAFSGNVDFFLDNNLLLVRHDKIQKRATVNPSSTPFASDSSQDYSGPIAAGLHTGIITLTLIS